MGNPKQGSIEKNPPCYIGVDVGSTTAKAVVLDAATHEVLFQHYVRHHARQADCVKDLLIAIRDRFSERTHSFRTAFCGSGGAQLAAELGVSYVQEVVATSIAVGARYPHARTAIELGGQDAKMVFFEPSETSEKLNVSDMRMNGSCAGGTGAFIDEIATLLKVPVESFNSLASSGKAVHTISGRCGVYAKTDIQPLLNQGVSKEDIVLSSLHAIAKQTIGGLAQGLDISPPVVFEGGPLTFNPRLIDVFAERLDLSPEAIIIPDHPETFVAFGAALSLDDLFVDQTSLFILDDAISTLDTIDFTVVDGVSCMAAENNTNAAIVHRPSDHIQKRPFFLNETERAEFYERHTLPAPVGYVTWFQEDGQNRVSANQLDRDNVPDLPKRLPVFLGFDCGSTTTKFAVLDSNENLIDSFYASNEGEPLAVARAALIELRDAYRAQGCELEVLSCGTTGYGELMFAQAFGADCHTVETVAHARAAEQYEPDATFILDIGGQDMKAIWMDGGIITNVVVNEACSSGCGSFLENFASTLHIPVEDIKDAAFRSQYPADLGSRCTVFMNSSIVTEQKNGKTPDDIMAGLCRSIIENVFTKVIRVSNLESLGDRIVVQGGTFLNDAVLRAFENYIGHSVVRAAYPGLMGAIGIALTAKERYDNVAIKDEGPSADRSSTKSSFIGFDALDDFSYEQETNLVCPFCANHCNRTRIMFSNETSWVTGNRCPRGEVIGDPQNVDVRRQLRAAQQKMDSVPNVYVQREKLLFQEWPFTQVASEQPDIIGLPRVLSYWDSMPFWQTLFRSLGFRVKLSHLSTRSNYEQGLSAVTSDTVCFPAKLIHGHVRDLCDQGVSRIFLPSVTTVPSENTSQTSQSRCAVVKGYPMVMRNSDNPEKRQRIIYDNPLFHWFSKRDRDRQLKGYFKTTFCIAEDVVTQAIDQADAAQASFRDQLVAYGAEVLGNVREQGGYAIVLAGRPYHNDALVNHELPSFFTEYGIPVLCADAIPGINEVSLDLSRIDIVNNYHARMLSLALIAAKDPVMEYVQIVSFGCGHDAYLSDEIIRLMNEAGPKTPLILKVDESDISGPLRIRTRSFIETINRKRTRNNTVPFAATYQPPPHVERKANSKPDSLHNASETSDETNPCTACEKTCSSIKIACEEFAAAASDGLSEPYPQKYCKSDLSDRVTLVPNTSHAFSRLMTSVFTKQGMRAQSLPIGRERAIYLGKKYVHNDICFPAQIVIGEALAALESGNYDLDNVAIATGKYIGDCRLTHYAALLRKALDDAGYEQVPIVTNDAVDAHGIHPGFTLSLFSNFRIAYGLPMIDALEELLRKMRPYEREPGSANAAFDAAIDLMTEGLESGGLHGMKKGFARGIEVMKQVSYDRSKPLPCVLIVGEYLLNFHPGANHDIEDYLERNGLEIIEAKMTDVIRKTYFYQDAQVREYKVDRPVDVKIWNRVANMLFERAHDFVDRVAGSHPLYVPPTRLPDLVGDSDPIIHHTFDAGEGVLIPAEILHHAKHGCRAFVILQPFGCLPNHVVGRGISKRLKELYPDATILPLDYDPDVSFANVENRLQMLIMNVRRASGL